MGNTNLWSAGHLVFYLTQFLGLGCNDKVVCERSMELERAIKGYSLLVMVIVALSSYRVSTRLRKKWFSVTQLLA